MVNSKYSALPLERDHFFYQNSHPHISPVKLRYGVYFVSSKSDLCSAAVIATLYVTSWHIIPRYNGIALYNDTDS